jgi:hypothetical protein
MQPWAGTLMSYCWLSVPVIESSSCSAACLLLQRSVVLLRLTSFPHTLVPVHTHALDGVLSYVSQCLLIYSPQKKCSTGYRCYGIVSCKSSMACSNGKRNQSNHLRPRAQPSTRQVLRGLSTGKCPPLRRWVEGNNLCEFSAVEAYQCAPSSLSCLRIS